MICWCVVPREAYTQGFNIKTCNCASHREPTNEETQELRDKYGIK